MSDNLLAVPGVVIADHHRLNSVHYNANYNATVSSFIYFLFKMTPAKFVNGVISRPHITTKKKKKSQQYVITLVITAKQIQISPSTG